MRWLRENWDKIQFNPIFVTLLLAVLLLRLIIPYTVIVGGGYDELFWENLAVELNAMLIELFIIVLMIMWITKAVEKRNKIKIYKEEIEEFRHWESDEAKYRIVGNIKRLNRLGIYKIDLSSCYLKKAVLRNAKLQGSDLLMANLQDCDLSGTDLEGARLCGINLQNAILLNTNITGADLSDSQLQNVNLVKTTIDRVIWTSCNLSDANISGMNFENTDLYEVNFTNANLDNTNLKGASLQFAILTGTRNLTIEQLGEVKSLWNASLDDNLLKQVQAKFPHLLND